ncbi:MAG: hypothetical protein Q9195_000713 [Heterodermia aff. obscurata]
MSATPPRHVPELPVLPATNPLPLPPPALEQDKQFKEIVTGEADDRSSSLSEIEERGITERLDIAPSMNGSDVGDTEAETERLEDSPYKVRSQQNVVLTATAGLHGNGEAQSNDAVETQNLQNQNNIIENEKMLQTSDISSLDDFSDVEVVPTKRLGSILVEEKIETREQSRLGSPDTYGDEVPAEDTQEYQRNDEEMSGNGASKVLSRKKFKGKQNGKKTEVDSVQDAADLATEIGIIMAPLPTIETSYKNGVGVEDPADGAEIETSVKSEEGLVKKKTALDALGAIEQCFANLKEKLYDERIARCDAELAMLDSSTPTHPELLAALEVIDRHRDEKIRYEDTLIKYKLGALQRKSIAEKAQAHTQYMLRVQDIRETHLTKLNEHFYNIQHERRATDTAAQDYMYHFQPKKSDQIRRQAAYNKEVSLLSGIAKYVGFPAAPDIKGLKQNEIDDDLRAMGITLQPAPVAPTLQPAIPRPSLPLSASFSRKSTADERFLEQNPWANPQHPAHGHLQRQRSAVSRPDSPLVTPAPQKRVVDLTVPQGSASTIADPLSGPNSSLAPTPATGEENVGPTKSRNGYPHINSTPMKAPDPLIMPETHDFPLNKDLKPDTAKHPTPKQTPPIYGPVQKGSSINDPLPIPDGPIPYSTTSPIPRFPTVKVEERPTAHALLLDSHAPSVLNETRARFGSVV